MKSKIINISPLGNFIIRWNCLHSSPAWMYSPTGKISPKKLNMDFWRENFWSDDERFLLRKFNISTWEVYNTVTGFQYTINIPSFYKPHFVGNRVIFNKTYPLSTHMEIEYDLETKTLFRFGEVKGYYYGNFKIVFNNEKNTFSILGREDGKQFDFDEKSLSPIFSDVEGVSDDNFLFCSRTNILIHTRPEKSITFFNMTERTITSYNFKISFAYISSDNSCLLTYKEECIYYISPKGIFPIVSMDSNDFICIVDSSKMNVRINKQGKESIFNLDAFFSDNYKSSLLNGVVSKESTIRNSFSENVLFDRHIIKEIFKYLSY